MVGALVKDEFPFRVRKLAQFHSAVAATEESVLLMDSNWA
jgi:hypothetical protein